MSGALKKKLGLQVESKKVRAAGASITSSAEIRSHSNDPAGPKAGRAPWCRAIVL
jgi:hypothetical protein